MEIGRRLALPALTAALLVAAMPALAADDPKITEAPKISGEFRVGATLVVTAKWKGGDPIWTWLRCADDKPGGCAEIAGQQAPAYTAAAQDAGERLRVRLTVRGEDEDKPKQAVSQPTPPIAPGRPLPGDPPGSLPPPAPPGAPAPAPPSASPVTTPPAVGGKAAPRLMSPLPIVRIRGRLTADGARVTLLTVRAPAGARIAVKCAGDDCPRRRVAIVAVIVHLRPYERVLRAGTRLEIRVTRPSFIGKYTRIVLRRGRPPLRQDRCLMPGSSRPVTCPAG